jgi:protein gp37
MGDKSQIEWTDASWNPVTGCTEISPGCDHCYAKTFAERWRGIKGHVYEQGFDLKLWEKRLEMPLRWTRPRRIFVNSMSDLFHKDVPYDFILRVFDVMNRAHWHQFQVLTKRSGRLLRFAPAVNWTSNIWMGVSIESDTYTFRADHLRGVPAAVRFISAEPLLGPLPSLDLTNIDWLIVGGESGNGARPMHPQWARDLRDRCGETGTAFFFKQWGNWLPGESEPLPGPVHTHYWRFQNGSAFPTNDKGLMSRTWQGVPEGQHRVRKTIRPFADNTAFVRLTKGWAGRTLDDVTHDAMPVPLEGV